MNELTIDERRQVLHDYLQEGEVSEIVSLGTYSYSFANQAYLVLTKEESVQQGNEAIKEKLYEVPMELIYQHSKPLKDANNEEVAIKVLNDIKRCLGMNSSWMYIQLIGDEMERFLKRVRFVIGVAAFLSLYDGEEIEVEVNGLGKVFIYRVE